jgi:carbon-monoxide dehydrogenase medium subunit
MKYLRVSTIEEAQSGLAEGGVVLAGGTVLVPNIAHEGAYGKTIVDIGRIPDLTNVSTADGHLRIGAMVTLAHIAANTAIRRDYEALARAAAAIGNPQVRRAATLGGNVALGTHTSDTMPALLALDAEVEYFGSAGMETRPIADFVTKGKLITAISVRREGNVRSGFRKFAWRRASGISVVSVAVALRIEDGLIKSSRLTVNGLAKRAARLPKAESVLAGQPLTEKLAGDAASAAADEAVAEIEHTAGEHYRRSLLRFGVRETLKEAMHS